MNIDIIKTDSMSCEKARIWCDKNIRSIPVEVLEKISREDIAQLGFVCGWVKLRGRLLKLVADESSMGTRTAHAVLIALVEEIKKST